MSTPGSGTPNPRENISCNCPGCGLIPVPRTSLTLVVCEPHPDRSFYQFTCLKCSGLVTKQASERVVKGLITRGVPAQRLPAEAMEVRGNGDPISRDDELDLALALADDVVVAKALSLLAAAEKHRTNRT